MRALLETPFAITARIVNFSAWPARGERQPGRFVLMDTNLYPTIALATRNAMCEFAQAAVTGWVVSKTEIYILTALEARSSRSRCRRGRLLLRSPSLSCRQVSIPFVFTGSSLDTRR